MDERSARAVSTGRSAHAATYAFIDIETTGIDPRSDRAVEVSGSPTPAMVQPQLEALCGNAVIVAHNARFDLAFLPFLGHDAVLTSLGRNRDRRSAA